MFPLYPSSQMSAEQKGLGDSAMSDGVHATVSVEQPITIPDQSSQTTYHLKNGEKACPCCQFYGVSCRQVRATEDEATTRRNLRFFSSTKRKISHQEQLAEDSLFLTPHRSMSYRPYRRERILSALEINWSRTKHSMIMLMG